MVIAISVSSLKHCFVWSAFVSNLITGNSNWYKWTSAELIQSNAEANSEEEEKYKNYKMCVQRWLPHHHDEQIQKC